MSTITTAQFNKLKASGYTGGDEIESVVKELSTRVPSKYIGKPYPNNIWWIVLKDSKAESLEKIMADELESYLKAIP